MGHWIHCLVKWSKLQAEQDSASFDKNDVKEADQVDVESSDSVSFVTCFDEQYDTCKS